MNFGISFAPLVPETIVWVVLAIAFVLAALLVFARARGLWMRIVAMALFVLALANAAPEGIAVYNPAFDVTPAHLIRAIICERGLIQPVTHERIAEAISII